MLFDPLFNLMSPTVTFGLLAGIIGVCTAVTAMYVRYETHQKKCLGSNDPYPY